MSLPRKVLIDLVRYATHFAVFEQPQLLFPSHYLTNAYTSTMLCIHSNYSMYHLYPRFP